MNIHTQNSPQASKTALPSKPNVTTVQTGATTSFPSHFTNFNPVDPAEDVNYTVPGWPPLARLISQAPDLEAFPSFSDLAIKSLLYYQAELVSLRRNLHKAEWNNFLQPVDEGSRDFAGNLDLLFLARDQAIKGNTELPQQWALMEKIRTTLEKYSRLPQASKEKKTNFIYQKDTALDQFAKVSAFLEAENANVRSLRECIKGIGPGGFALTGDGASTWGQVSDVAPEQKSLWKLFCGLFTGILISPDFERKPIPNMFQEHLIVPHDWQRPDSLTLYVIRSFIPFYDCLRRRCLLPGSQILDGFWHRLLPSKVDLEKPFKRTTTTSTLSQNDVGITNNITHYSGAMILRVTFIVMTLMACLLPSIAIIVLAM
jgi:hypothetical protein